MRTLFAVLLVSMVSVAQAEQIGDMDGDGLIDTTEAIISLKVAAGQDPGVPLGTYIPATGNAVATHVLSGKTFSNSSNSDVTGTMPNNTASTIIPGTTNKTIPEGYHDGSGSVAGDSNLTATNIKSGSSIFGINGDSEVINTFEWTMYAASPADVLAGKRCYINGEKIIGSIPTREALSITPGAQEVIIQSGYYQDNTVIAGDEDFLPENIKSPVVIFRIAGNYRGLCAQLGPTLTSCSSKCTDTYSSPEYQLCTKGCGFYYEAAAAWCNAERNNP